MGDSLPTVRLGTGRTVVALGNSSLPMPPSPGTFVRESERAREREKILVFAIQAIPTISVVTGCAPVGVGVRVLLLGGWFVAVHIFRKSGTRYMYILSPGVILCVLILMGCVPSCVLYTVDRGGVVAMDNFRNSGTRCIKYYRVR